MHVCTYVLVSEFVCVYNVCASTQVHIHLRECIRQTEVGVRCLLLLGTLFSEMGLSH